MYLLWGKEFRITLIHVIPIKYGTLLTQQLVLVRYELSELELKGLPSF